MYNSAPFLSCFSKPCLKIEKYFPALAVKIIYYQYFASDFYRFFDSSYSSKCRLRGICLFIPRPLRL